MSTTLKNCFTFSLKPFVAIFALVVAMLPMVAHSQFVGGKKDVRIMQNEDGSYSELSRSGDERTLYRVTYAKDKGGKGVKKPIMNIVYRKDKQGRLRSGTLHDGSGRLLYRIKYAYHKLTGQLVQENMYDAQVKRTKVITGSDGKPVEQEEPVRMLYHRYDAQGRAMKPIGVTLPAGKMAEELFGKDKGSHIKDPWAK